MPINNICHYAVREISAKGRGSMKSWWLSSTKRTLKHSGCDLQLQHFRVLENLTMVCMTLETYASIKRSYPYDIGFPSVTANRRLLRGFPKEPNKIDMVGEPQISPCVWVKLPFPFPYSQLVRRFLNRLYKWNLDSSWKHVCLRNHLRCPGVIAVCETKIADTQALAPIFDNFLDFRMY